MGIQKGRARRKGLEKEREREREREREGEGGCVRERGRSARNGRTTETKRCLPKKKKKKKKETQLRGPTNQPKAEKNDLFCDQQWQ